MKKSIIIGVSILSIFILCSLSYQPIIADTPIEPIPMAKKSKASDLDVDELKELYTKLLELKSQSKDDCGCENTTGWDFPVLCTILYFIITPIAIFLWILGTFTRIRELNYLALKLLSIGEIFDCWWTFQ